MKIGVTPLAVICGLLFFFSQQHSPAAYYNYNMYYGNGVAGAVGNATLAMSNGTATVYANFVKGIGSFVENLVIFVDSAPGGFSTTSGFNDNGNGLESSISGYKISRSTATFAPGFEADYAIALGINSGSAVYKLVDDGTGPHLQLVRNGLNFQVADSPNHPTYSFQFDWVDLGLPAQRTNFFKFETTYISPNGYRYLQTFEEMTGKEGYDFVTFTNYDTYGVPPIPETTNLALVVFGGIAAGATLLRPMRNLLSPGGRKAPISLNPPNTG